MSIQMPNFGKVQPKPLAVEIFCSILADCLNYNLKINVC